MLPAISIVTPTLNQARFIEKTIESVLSQNYPNLEYLIIDGGSTDGTIEILKNYGHLVKWISEPDHGQVDAINKGLRKLSGEIVAYLNSDDVYSPGTLLTIGDFFQNNQSAQIVTGKCHNIDAMGNPTRSFITHYKNLMLCIGRSELLKLMNYISQPATFWKRTLHDELGYLNPDFRYAMDYDFWLRVSQTYKIHFIDEYLASFRIYPTSITSSNSKQQYFEEYRVASQYSKVFSKILHKAHAGMSYLAYWLMNRSN